LKTIRLAYKHFLKRLRSSIPPLKRHVGKPIIEGFDFVGTGLVLQDESFRMNPCPNFKADSHTVRQAHHP